MNEFELIGDRILIMKRQMELLSDHLSNEDKGIVNAIICSMLQTIRDTWMYRDDLHKTLETKNKYLNAKDKTIKELREKLKQYEHRT